MSTSRQKKSGSNKDVTCFECKDPGHYKNEYPKLKPKKKFFREKNKVMMETRDDFESLEDYSKEEKANMVLKSSSEAFELESNSDEVFSHLTHSELELSLDEILEKIQKFKQRYKNLSQIHVVDFEAHT